MFDDQIVRALNHLLALDSRIFQAALWLSDRPMWIISVIVLVILWFSGKSEADRILNRQRVMLIFISMIVVYWLAHQIGALANRERPLISLSGNVALTHPLDPQVWQAVTASLVASSAFPDDQSAVWFVLVAGLFVFNWKAGLAAALVSLLFGAVRIGLGFEYLTDFIAGACIGILTFTLLYRFKAFLMWLIRPTVLLFEGLPMLTYPFGLLLLLDLSQRLTWIFSVLGILFRGAVIR